jgi:hypothetical protein
LRKPINQYDFMLGVRVEAALSPQTAPRSALRAKRYNKFPTWGGGYVIHIMPIIKALGGEC